MTVRHSQVPRRRIAPCSVGHIGSSSYEESNSLEGVKMYQKIGCMNDTNGTHADAADAYNSGHPIKIVDSGFDSLTYQMNSAEKNFQSSLARRPSNHSLLFDLAQDHATDPKRNTDGNSERANMRSFNQYLDDQQNRNNYVTCNSNFDRRSLAYPRHGCFNSSHRGDSAGLASCRQQARPNLFIQQAYNTN